VAKINLTASKAPKTAPKWLNNYGKHVKNEYVLFMLTNANHIHGLL